MTIINALQSVFTIFVMIGVGLVLSKKGWFNDDTSTLFSKLVTKIALPCYMIYNLLTNFDKASLSSSLVALLVVLASMFINFIIGFIINKTIKVSTDRGAFYCMFALSNTIFIGLPVNVSLFGEEATPYVLLYYIVNTLVFWTIGVYCIKKDGGYIKESGFNLSFIKNIFTPPLITFLIAVTFIFFQATPPKFIMDSCKYIGNLTTPLSLLFIGITLSKLNLKELKFDKYSIIISLGRFIVSPLVIAFLLSFTSFPILMKKVFIIEAAMPVMTQVAIVCKTYDSDYQSVSAISTLTTLLSLILFRLYAFIFIMVKISRCLYSFYYIQSDPYKIFLYLPY